jgi:GT2 family glycosyltransferase
LDISIIIVSWNVADDLRACLRSLENAGAGRYTVEVIVVDSASQDDTARIVRDEFPHVTLLALDENVGFTRGNNMGMTRASGRLLLLLNPDTEVIGDGIAILADLLDRDPTIGIAGPHTLNTDGTTQSTRRRFPDRRTALFETPWLRRFAPALIRRFEAADVADDATADIDSVQGSCMIVRRAVYEQVGGFDEGFVMYFEELDWCYRAKAAGWRVVYCGDAQIMHHGGRSSGQVSGRKHVYYNRSKVRYFSKVYGRGFGSVLRVLLKLVYVWQWLLEGGKWVLGLQRTLRAERLAAYGQVLRSSL